MSVYQRVPLFTSQLLRSSHSLTRKEKWVFSNWEGGVILPDLISIICSVHRGDQKPRSLQRDAC